MRKLGDHAAEAWPISRVGPNGYPFLEKVVVASHHPDGDGMISVSPDQVLYVQSRLSHVTTAFLHGHPAEVHHLGVDHMPDGPVHEMRRCRARVWPISHQSDSLLDKVVVESEHPDGNGTIQLNSDQARYIHSRLTQISLAFLHDNHWGGEDATMQ
jgi:hypothetical protein